MRVERKHTQRALFNNTTRNTIGYFIMYSRKINECAIHIMTFTFIAFFIAIQHDEYNVQLIDNYLMLRVIVYASCIYIVHKFIMMFRYCYAQCKHTQYIERRLNDMM